MKNSMKFLGIIVLAAAGLGMIACPTGGDDDDDGDNGSFSLATLKTPDGVKSAYLSDIPVNGGGRAAADGDTISSLSYITSTGQNAPVLFSTPLGKKQFIFDVTSLEQLGEQCMIITTDGFYEVTGTGDAGSYTVGPKVYTYYNDWYYYDKKIGQTAISPKIVSVLIDMQNSKLYNFSEFQGNNSWEQNNSRFMEGSIIYTAQYEESTVYKIDLSTASVDSALQAIPLNNSVLMPIKYIQLPYTINNKLIGNKEGYYYNGLYYYYDKIICLDVSGAIQPEEYKAPVLPPGADPVDIFKTNVLLRDLTGKPWAFIDDKNYLTAAVSIDSSGQCTFGSTNTVPLSPNVSAAGQIFTFNAAGVGSALINTHTDSLSISYQEFIKMRMRSYLNHGVATLNSKGFIRLRPEVDGIKAESVEVTLPASLEGKSVISKEDYLFWLENKSIKRQKLEAGSSPQTVYSNPGIADNFATRDLLTASGRKLIFYQYAAGSATEIHTYSLDMYNPNAQPELLATNDAEVRSIVELDF